MDSDSDDDRSKKVVAKKSVAKKSASPAKKASGGGAGTKKANTHRAKGKKREFDRHVSGTGRDKSIKKGGGGARNWGKPTE